jgi:cystathionine gamma-lyase
VYGGTNRYFNRVAVDFGLTFSMTDITSVANCEAALKPNTKMVWIETPTNPMLKVIDLEQVISWAKSKNLLTVVDNTFATPYLQNPLAFGADLVLHSITKYIGGHSDVVGGCLVTDRDDLAKRLHFLQNCTGGIPGPFDCFLAQRGMKTLHVRMEAHMRGAAQIVDYLLKHPKIEKVTYPGLASHPQHELAKKQMRGFGGMITFVIKGGFAEAKTFLSSLKIIALAESLGGVESLAEHPATMTHASVPADQRRALGIADGLIRMSVGIEDAKDLIADITQALEKC